MATSNPARPKNSNLFRILVGTSLILVLLFFFSNPILTMFGALLIHIDKPHPTSAIIVLAGGSGGDRILKACELVRAGYAPKAWVSGPQLFYGQSEASFAIKFAIDHGCDPDWFEAFPNHCRSTQEEAIFFREILKERQAGDFTIVTSSFHTKRARRIFMKEIPDLPITVIASQAEFFSADSWWKNREGRKIFVQEFLKTLTSPFGI